MTLSLYSFRPGALEDAPHGPARALGDLAVTCLVRDRSYRAALTELDQLGAALRTRPVVDQACGIVMHVLGCDADAAFGVLRRVSQATQRKLSDVASAVVDKRGRGLERELVSCRTDPLGRAAAATRVTRSAVRVARMVSGRARPRPGGL